MTIYQDDGSLLTILSFQVHEHGMSLHSLRSFVYLFKYIYIYLTVTLLKMYLNFLKTILLEETRYTQVHTVWYMTFIIFKPSKHDSYKRLEIEIISAVSKGWKY